MRAPGERTDPTAVYGANGPQALPFNQQTQQTAMIFTQKADGWFKHRLVPMPLQNVYMNAKTYVAWGADKLGS